MSIKLIEYKGKKIFYADYRGLSGQELIKSMNEANQDVIKHKHELFLADFREASISNEVMEFLKGKEAKEATSYFKKQAILGISGIKKFAVNAYNTITQSNMRIFNEENEAKEYLVS